jgi:hypothetical protein
MDRFPNKSEAKRLQRILVWLNQPREELPDPRRDEPMHAQKAWLRMGRISRDRLEPLILLLTAQMKNGGSRSQARKKINLMLEHYKFFPQLDPIKPGARATITWTAVFDFIFPEHEEEPESEWLAPVLFAFDRGLLARLQRCAYARCGRWFETADPRKKFHSPACKKGSYNETPEGKAKKRKYMKAYMPKYRRREKEKDDRLKKLARRG